ISGVAAFLCVALASSLFFHRRRTAADLFFFVGMLLLAIESIFQGLSLDAVLADQIEYWQSAGLVVKSLLVAVWFCFSLTYSRGDSAGFLKRARLLLLGLVLSVVLAVWFRSDLVRALPARETDLTWWLSFTLPGKVLNLLLLIGTVLILMNLERT